MNLVHQHYLGLQVVVLVLELLDLVLVRRDLLLHVADVLAGLLEHLGPARLVPPQGGDTLLDTENTSRLLSPSLSLLCRPAVL